MQAPASEEVKLRGIWVFLLIVEQLAGVTTFLADIIINPQADISLRALREPGEIVYSIPYGGLFNWISCPNYLGEINEWISWARSTWYPPGLAFAIWNFANLAPRARSHHA